MRNKQAIVTHSRLLQALHYDPETGVFIRLVAAGPSKVGDVTGNLGPKGYVRIGLDGRTYEAQRLAVFYMEGAWPPDSVDHRDLDKANNRWATLRHATRSQNRMNTRAKASGSSGVKGVCYHKASGRWQAAIDSRYLGLRSSPEEAGKLYEAAAREAYGEFARVE